MQPATHHLTWKQRQRQLNAIKTWDIKGSLGITYNNQTEFAHFKWQQQHDAYAITLSSTFDIGSINIVGNSKIVTLWKSKSDKVSATTPEELMQDELGWSLPLENLRYWITGLPAPKIKYNATYDSYNHLATLKQGNWNIQYLGFAAFKNIDLPLKLIISNPGLHVKIVINTWKL